MYRGYSSHQDKVFALSRATLVETLILYQGEGTVTHYTLKTKQVPENDEKLFLRKPDIWEDKLATLFG